MEVQVLSLLIDLQKEGITEFTTLLSQESKTDIMQVFEGRLTNNHPTLLNCFKKNFAFFYQIPKCFFCIYFKPT